MRREKDRVCTNYRIGINSFFITPSFYSFQTSESKGFKRFFVYILLRLYTHIYLRGHICLTALVTIVFRIAASPFVCFIILVCESR